MFTHHSATLRLLKVLLWVFLLFEVWTVGRQRIYGATLYNILELLVLTWLELSKVSLLLSYFYIISSLLKAHILVLTVNLFITCVSCWHRTPIWTLQILWLQHLLWFNFGTLRHLNLLILWTYQRQLLTFRAWIIWSLGLLLLLTSLVTVRVDERWNMRHFDLLLLILGLLLLGLNERVHICDIFTVKCDYLTLFLQIFLLISV